MVRLKRERGQKFGAGQIIDILLGKRTAKVIQFDHDQLSVFGIGEELTEGEWRGVARQLLAQGLLAVEGEYGTLVLTEASGEVLRREREVPLRKEPRKPASTRASGGGRGDRKAKAAAAELPAELLPAFEALRTWRAEQAREQGVPAYVIFHDATLREIATAWPTSIGQLGGISGVGEKKLATYGEGVLAVLAALEGPAAAAGPPRAARRSVPSPVRVRTTGRTWSPSPSRTTGYSGTAAYSGGPRRGPWRAPWRTAATGRQAACRTRGGRPYASAVSPGAKVISSGTRGTRAAVAVVRAR